MQKYTNLRRLSLSLYLRHSPSNRKNFTTKEIAKLEGMIKAVRVHTLVLTRVDEYLPTEGIRVRNPMLRVKVPHYIPSTEQDSGACHIDTLNRGRQPLAYNIKGCALFPNY
eukprot:1193240-Prorocentrum_minimum.AAC.3